ncbi:MAG: hypothetical protein K1X38_14765 [Microthrixaceae bacterium]|nr:hypothetical protein [Microthrixaceae bacterium]
MSSHPQTTARPPAVLIGAVASLGAGAVHAAAIGAHAEHPGVVRTFAALAAVQLAWGALMLARPSGRTAAEGAALGAVSVLGWLVAKTIGIGFVDGLEIAEPVQWADGVAAGLAAVAALSAAAWWRTARSYQSSAMPIRLARRPVSIAVVAIAVVGLSAMNAAATHHHAGEDHSHADGETASHHDDSDSAHAHPAAPLTKPYDPTEPIDLGGVDGVTPDQQARAENLVANTLWKLPQFADWTALEARGYHSIRDDGTGYEHFVNWDALDDGRQLDPDHPESVVFEIRPDGTKQLASAMFFAEPGTTLDNVPDIGGALTQWHIHDDLCFTGDPPRIAGITSIGGPCAPGTQKLGDPRPMIHVWIVPNECGPFAALEGIGAGQVRTGETRACDTAHGSHHR